MSDTLLQEGKAPISEYKMLLSNKIKTSIYLVFKLGINSFILWIQPDLVCVHCRKKTKQKDITENYYDDKYFSLTEMFITSDFELVIISDFKQN